MKYLRWEEAEISPRAAVELFHDSFQERIEQGLIMGGSLMTEERFLEMIRNDIVYVAIDGSHLAGFANAKISNRPPTGEKYLEMRYVAIAPDYKRTGIGSRLFELVIEVAKEEGCTHCISDTATTASSSIAWHKSNGFRIVGWKHFHSREYNSYVFRKELVNNKIRNNKLFASLAFIRSWLRIKLHIDLEELSLKEIQAKSLEILRDVDSFCRKEQISYSLAYGTLIGAIRHKGFIPWDDDIDIVMPRADYERFVKTYKSKKFRLLSPENDKDCFIAYSRVYDEDETIVRTTLPFAKKYRGGIWIDLFPLDGAEDDFSSFKRQIGNLTELFDKQLYFRDAVTNPFYFHSVKKILGAFKRKVMRRNGRGLPDIIRKMRTLATQYPYGSTGHWSQFTCMDDGTRNYQLMEDFSSTIDVEFEGHLFPAMNGYDRVLRNIYGNYMELPPEEQRVPKQGYLQIYWKPR